MMTLADPSDAFDRRAHASYRQAAAVPMIPKAVKPAAAAQPQPAAASEAPSEPLAPQRVTPDNPTGIVF